jgi:hypothetical protein
MNPTIRSNISDLHYFECFKGELSCVLLDFPEGTPESVHEVVDLSFVALDKTVSEFRDLFSAARCLMPDRDDFVNLDHFHAPFCSQ